MKTLKLISLLMISLFCVNMVSAWEFDNTIKYENNNLKVTLTNNNFLGIGDLIGYAKDLGTLELKSHPTTDYIKKVNVGNPVVMWYDFNFEDVYINGLGDVNFIDMKTKELVKRDYKFVYWVEDTINTTSWDCKEAILKNGTLERNCLNPIIIKKVGGYWEDYNLKDIPKGNLRIGIKVNVKEYDFIDAVWEVGGKKVSLHASYEAEVIDAHGNVQSTTDTTTLGLGGAIVPTYNVLLTGVTRTTGTTPTQAQVYYGVNKSLLATSSGLVSDTYTFNIELTANELYIIEVNSAGATYTQVYKTPAGGQSFPIVKTNINYVWGTVNAGASNSTQIQTLESVTTRKEVAGTVPSVTLTSPANASNLTSGNIDFIATVTDALYVQNVTLYLNGVANETKATHVNGSYTFSKIRPEGYQNWSILAWNNLTLSNQSDTWFFNVTILAPTINLNSPADDVYVTSQIQDFNGTVADDTGVKNVSFLVAGSVIETNTSGFNNSNYLFNYDFGADGSYVWAYQSYDIDNESSTSSRTINIDTVPPVLTITNNTYTLTYNLPIEKTVTLTVADDNPDTCSYWTSENATNITTTCGVPFNISFTSGGNKTVYGWVNDSVGYTANAQDSFYINYLEDSVSYINPVIELDLQTIYLNVTATEITTFTANITYNATVFPMTVSNNGTLGQAYIEITNPSASTITFNFTYDINGFTNTTSNYTQTLNALTPINVTNLNCSDKAITFVLQDEVNATNLTGTIDYNIKYGPSNNNEHLEAYGSIANTTTLNICINATATPFYYIGYGEIQYSAENYVDRRFYLFEDSVISNNTYNTKYLRLLESSEQTSFLLTLQDSDLNVYGDKYTALWRWYPDLNAYKIAEMGKTDADGQTVAHVRTEDVDYRTALYYLNGSLIKFDSPRRFLCTSSPCSLDIVVGDDGADLTAFFDIEQSLVYNETTGIITYTFNDPNQLTQSMRLKVEKINPTTEIILCDDTTTGYTGVINCNISIYTGSFKATAYRTASPEVPIAQKLISTTDTLFRSSFGLFFSVMLWLAIVLTGLAGGPILTVVLAIVALLPALFLGSINLAIFTGFAVLGAIILHFIKRSMG